jgi:hypothetical protein
MELRRPRGVRQKLPVWGCFEHMAVVVRSTRRRYRHRLFRNPLRPSTATRVHKRAASTEDTPEVRGRRCNGTHALTLILAEQGFDVLEQSQRRAPRVSAISAQALAASVERAP